VNSTDRLIYKLYSSATSRQFRTKSVPPPICISLHFHTGTKIEIKSDTRQEVFKKIEFYLFTSYPQQKKYFLGIVLGIENA